MSEYHYSLKDKNQIVILLYVIRVSVFFFLIKKQFFKRSISEIGITVAFSAGS